MWQYVCVGRKDLYLLNEKSLLYVCTWPCAYIYNNSSNWWGVMINDVVDEKHPATIITKHVHKHTKLWNSERWWSFSDTVIAGRVWSACYMLGWSGYHWRRALVTHTLWRASCDVYEKHMWSGQWEEKYDSSNHLWQFSVKCNPAKHTHTHTHTHTQSEWIFFCLTQTPNASVHQMKI